MEPMLRRQVRRCGDSQAFYFSRLYQSFVVPAGNVTSAVLTFDNADIYFGGGFAYAKVQLSDLSILASFTPFDVFGTGSETQPWAGYSWDVTSLLQAHQGETITLALTAYQQIHGFVPSNSPNTFYSAFDNVALTVTMDSSVPEPPASALIGGVFGVAWYMRTRFR
jgi:hypothetical protein